MWRAQQMAPVSSSKPAGTGWCGATGARAASSLRSIALLRGTWRQTPDHKAIVFPSFLGDAAAREGHAAGHL